MKYQVSKYWATVEADRFHSMDEARKIWSSLMQSLGENAEHWLDYINLEKMYGDAKHIRRLFVRALERTHDQPDRISEAWLQFEREEGSLEQFEEAEKKIKARMKIVISQRNEERGKKDMHSKKDKDKYLKAGAKNTWESKDNARKRKNQYQNGQRGMAEEPIFKKPNLSHNAGQQLHQSEGSIAKTSGNRGTIPPPPGFKQTPLPPGYKPHENEKAPGNITTSKNSDTIVIFPGAFSFS